MWQFTSEICDLMAAYVQSKGTIDPQQINTKNFTLVPDLYAHYFATGQATAQTTRSARVETVLQTLRLEGIGPR